MAVSIWATTATDLLAPSPRPADNSRGVLHIVIFNAWKDNKNPQRAAEWIARQSADVLILAEIDWSSGGIPRRLKRLYPYQQDCSGRKRCSTAILSRVKPLASGGLARGDPENRGALSAAWIRLADSCGSYEIVGVHLNHPWPLPTYAGERGQLVQFLHGQSGDRSILAGDLNLPPWMFELRQLEHATGLSRRTVGLPTWPSPSAGLWWQAPFFPLDHVLAGRGWVTEQAIRGPDLGSDHYPVSVTLRSSKVCT